MHRETSPYCGFLFNKFMLQDGYGFRVGFVTSRKPELPEVLVFKNKCYFREEWKSRDPPL